MKDFPALNWEAIFRRYQIERECGIKARFFYYAMRNIFFCIVDNVDLRLLRSHDGSKILFYQSFFSRESSRRQFYDVQEIVDSDLISYNQKRGRCVHILLGLYLIFINLPVWFFQLRRKAVPISECPRYIHSLIKFFFVSRRIETLSSLGKYKLLVTFCDAYPEESFVSQLCKYKGVKTATLQHGAFSAWRENELINSGVELRCFNSDYLLCWNSFTVEEARKCNIPEEKLVVVGILGYVKNEPVNWTCPHNKTFGVVIGHESFENENLMMIECANRIAEKENMDFYLKLHPNYGELYFNDKVSKAHYKGNIKKGIPIAEYAEMVDFSIVGSSSVFLELVFINHDVIRYSSGEVTDKFRDVRIGKIIHSVEEIDKVINVNPNNAEGESGKLFSFLCGKKNVKEEYKKFFLKCVG